MRYNPGDDISGAIPGYIVKETDGGFYNLFYLDGTPVPDDELTQEQIRFLNDPYGLVEAEADFDYDARSRIDYEASDGFHHDIDDYIRQGILSED